MKTKVKMAYKCPLCGMLILSTSVREVEYNDLPSMCGKMVANQRFVGTTIYNEPLQIPHKCKDGSCGMAYFAGFKKEE